MISLIDSNILIYSFLSEYQYLRETITNEFSCISEISRVEILGFHGLKKDDEKYFLDIFDVITIIAPSTEIFDCAIQIRKSHRLKLGDSIIAATALVNGLTLYTRNVSDFDKVTGLKCVNPIK